MLERLGLDKKEEKVYMALLRLADAPAARIAKEAGLKRTSAYHTLENLVRMGLVATYEHRGVQRYAAESPSKLKSYFEEKLILVERIIPFLQKEAAKDVKRINIRFFEGEAGLRNMSGEALEAKEKKILTLGSSKTLLKFLGGKHGFGERRRKKGVLMKSLRFPGDEKSTNPKLHQAKYLPETFQFPGYIQIFDNKVGIFLFEGAESAGAGFSITSDAFSKMARSIFESLWEKAEIK